MNAPEIPTVQPSLWKEAEQRCWKHVEVSTAMMRLMTTLGDLEVQSVFPILSDSNPSLMITPVRPEDINSVRALSRIITAKLDIAHSWDKFEMNAEWMLRLKHNGINIDVMTRLPSVTPAPLSL